MPRPSKFVTGQQLGRLTALSKVGGRYARYRCICGTEKLIDMFHVMGGKVQSCGCLHRERASEALSRRMTKHGMYGTPEYRTWNSMLTRCYSEKCHAYPSYGGRGILVAPKWHRFPGFFADMGLRPPGFTLERKNNELGYSKNNCVWATRTEQANNTRSCKQLSFRGEVMNVTQWAEKLGIPRQRIYSRLRLGWSAEHALLGKMK